MMKYFAYENWRAHGHVVKVHRADCPFCNNGRGLAGGTRADNGRWIDLGACNNTEEAMDLATRRTTAPNLRSCGSCL